MAASSRPDALLKSGIRLISNRPSAPVFAESTPGTGRPSIAHWPTCAPAIGRQQSALAAGLGRHGMMRKPHTRPDDAVFHLVGSVEHFQGPLVVCDYDDAGVLFVSDLG